MSLAQSSITLFIKSYFGQFFNYFQINMYIKTTLHDCLSRDGHRSRGKRGVIVRKLVKEKCRAKRVDLFWTILSQKNYTFSNQLLDTPLHSVHSTFGERNFGQGPLQVLIF